MPSEYQKSASLSLADDLGLQVPLHEIQDGT